MTTNTENKPTVIKPSPPTIRARLEGDAFKNEIAKALPRHLSPDRFIRIAITAMTRTPKLKDCDQASFFSALLTLSQLGIEPDGRRAHLIPFENRKRNCVECQLIVDYKGLAELVMRSGTVSYLHADIVREGDLFEYSLGEIKQHVPWFLRPRDSRPEKPGEIFAAYAITKMKDGTSKAEVMSIEDVNSIRSRSRAGQSGPWVSDWNEMAKKTAFRRLSKWLPLSPEYRDATEIDDDTPEPIQIREAKVSSVVDDIPFDFGSGESIEHVVKETAGATTEALPSQETATFAKTDATPGGTSEAADTGNPQANACDRLSMRCENAGLTWLAVENWAKERKLDANKETDAEKILRAWKTVEETLKIQKGVASK